MMRRFVITLIALVAVLAVVLFLKMNGNILIKFSNPTPEKTSADSSSSFATIDSLEDSNEDVEKLILKGKENIRKENNVYYESATTT